MMARRQMEPAKPSVELGELSELENGLYVTRCVSSCGRLVH